MLRAAGSFRQLLTYLIFVICFPHSTANHKMMSGPGLSWGLRQGLSRAGGYPVSFREKRLLFFQLCCDSIFFLPSSSLTALAGTTDAAAIYLLRLVDATLNCHNIVSIFASFSHLHSHSAPAHFTVLELVFNCCAGWETDARAGYYGVSAHVSSLLTSSLALCFILFKHMTWHILCEAKWRE